VSLAIELFDFMLDIHLGFNGVSACECLSRGSTAYS
jgi:hypothetical protein